MKKSFYKIFLQCGIALMLAAFPVFAQKTELVKEVQINKMPLLDFGSLVKYRVSGKEVDLSQSFKIILEGVLDKTGKFDRQQSRFISSEGNAQTAEIAKSAIEAFDDSGWFAYLRNLGAEKVRITLEQDLVNFNAAIESELVTQERAKALASALAVYISLAKPKITGQDEKTILSGLQQPTASGKVFMLNFALPKQTVQDMINRGLK
jgi:hypothetical protein